MHASGRSNNDLVPPASLPRLLRRGRNRSLVAVEILEGLHIARCTAIARDPARDRIARTASCENNPVRPEKGSSFRARPAKVAELADAPDLGCDFRPFRKYLLSNYLQSKVH